MASPWKRLTQWVSARRSSREDEVRRDNDSADVAAAADLAPRLDEEDRSRASESAAGEAVGSGPDETVAVNQSNPDSTDTSLVQSPGHRRRARNGPALSGAVNSGEPSVGETSGSAKKDTRAIRAKTNRPAPEARQMAQPASRDDDVVEALILDEEIRALRAELAQKLKRQNQHLKQMVGRYQRGI
ncbi:MAG TPA: hypothetical protein VGO22_07180 [Pseudorhizobium sp.]|jgi:hypothetical protein|nr:hypothetical protein [Pseudorhizobium sp.]